MSIFDQTHNRDPFALAGQSTESADAKILGLFRRWMDLTRAHYRAPDYDFASSPIADAAIVSRKETEDEIIATPGGGAVGLAVKTYLLVDRRGCWAPEGAHPVLRLDADDDLREREDILLSLLRDVATVVPELVEPLAPLIHEDAVLIDADIEIEWCNDRLANSDASSPQTPQYRSSVEGKLDAALDVIAATTAKTERGQAIKEKHGLVDETAALSAPDLPALVAERNRIWHSNAGDASNPAISDDERERRTKRVCAQVNVLENRIADMVAPSVDGVLAQFDLLMELVELGGWADARDERLIGSIKAGLRNLLAADAGDSA
jgi:hypothetical protein